jgi:hypothetical protein
MIKKVLGAATGLALLSQSALAIVTTPSSNGSDLANLILGSGITISSATFTGASGSAGSFTGGTAAGIGIESGLLLTSGQVANVNGSVNTETGKGTGNGAPGWAPLSTIAAADTYDAARLEIKFTTTGGDLFFNYVFGSDEYNEFVDAGFNDVFAFLLDGDTALQNVAKLPVSGDPVSIDNVNLGKNAGLFNNNAQNGAFPFEYDGFTDVLQVQALGLSAGEHIITLAIADSGDSILDSGVFIQGGTFSDTPQPPSGVPDGGATILLLGAALSGLGVLRRKI